jgi:transcription termination/antitermination protein NusA
VFTRIGAQAAAQTIKQQIKALEKERFYEKFQDKQGELLKAKVLRAVGDTVILDIDGTSVVLLPEGQIRGKMYSTGEEIFVLLRKIDKDVNGVLLDITQASTDFIESLLNKIIPELQEGRVYIDKIVRVPGKRTKVVVGTNEDNIDPVGVFVGQKGNRITTILTLLDGEKMDFIEYDGNNDAKFVADSLKPARVTSVEIEGGKAYVTLPEDQKSLAIGK